MVPVALTWWVAMGSVRERGTEGRAAKWTTAWAPAITPSRSSALRMEPSTSSTEGESTRFSGEPVEKSSRATTWSTKSCRASIRQRFAPMKPAPPVTTTFTDCVRPSQRFDLRSAGSVAGVEHVPGQFPNHVVVEARRDPSLPPQRRPAVLRPPSIRPGERGGPGWYVRVSELDLRAERL